MPEDSPLLWRITDGKAGHESQSFALVDHLARLAGFRSLDVPVATQRQINPATSADHPRLIVGAGHRTHLAILSASRRYDCPSVVIMKPTIPSAFFDLCLIPEHDLSGPPADNVVATRGMLNRIPPEIPPKEQRGLFLIGGPSKHHGWDSAPLLEAISHLVKSRPGLDWQLTDSRRTPADFLPRLTASNLTIHASAHTPPAWLPDQLVAAQEVWVTEDSMSMIYEALTAQARVGLLPMPRLSPRSRVVRGIDRLVASGWARFFSTSGGGDLPDPPGRLHEASRCAREVLQRFFPTLA